MNSKSILIKLMLGFWSLASITSCQESETPKTQVEETAKESSETNPVEEFLIDTNAVLSWNTIRQDTAQLMAAFGSGNTFSITFPNEGVSRIHAYLGFNNGQVEFYFVDAAADIISNLDCLGEAYLSTTFDPLPDPMDTAAFPDTNSIANQVANQRINDWMDTEKRNDWIRNEDTVLQAFIIHADDISFGDEHTGYLALRQDENNPSIYCIDLILMNSQTNEVVSLVAKADSETGSGVIQTFSLQNMTWPIPPMKPSPYFPAGATEMSSFGLLEYLEIE